MTLAALLCLSVCAGAPLAIDAQLENPLGETYYVSRLGDNSDGLSWEKAFTSIQRALDAIPDATGGHCIFVRPDEYYEANLSPAHPGAAGAYNLLIGDTEGRYGSGTRGQVVVDACDPRKGFKSYDWYGTIRATTKGWSKEHTEDTFSAIVWDRWALRGLYVTGGDAGLFWDCTNRIEPFTVVVEDCVSIGRAFGGGVASCLSRPEEPITFRNCHLYALDWWGDTAAAYVRVENEALPDQPDVRFEHCTLVSPQCALKGGNFGFHTYMRIAVDRCDLICLNFSQPAGTPTDGLIQSVENGKYLALDLKDSTLMGYKIFGVRVDKDSADKIRYSTEGSVQAHVQYTQEVPQGIHRLGHWPVEVFAKLGPPPVEKPDTGFQNKRLMAESLCEITPLVWKGRLCHMECVRPGHGGAREDYYLLLNDAETGKELARFATGYGLGCALVHDETFYAFASRFEENNWNDVTCFWSKDLEHWESKRVIAQESEHLFNSSVCQGPDGFVMAYESNDGQWPAFTTKFATSPDLLNWTKKPESTFGLDRYTACPCIRYADGYYYVLYLERHAPLHAFESFITRSPDLIQWRRSAMNPVLKAEALDEGINASDIDLVEWGGKTYVYYTVGDQLTWMNVKRIEFPGSQAAFLKHWFAQPGIPDPGCRWRHEAAEAPRAATEAESAKAMRQAAFNEAKFGLFVHWGLYALHGKNAKGPYVSWAMENEGIPVESYAAYAEQFKPTRFDPDAWMRLAKEAGMRYCTFTSKHHEGFCMFDSALTAYDSQDCAAGRDFVGELVEAARRNDMKIAFYYSLLDWRHPDFKENLDRYIDVYAFGQVRELCTNYGPIDGIWFDGEWDHPAATWRAEELVNLIHSHQPLAWVNDRLGKGERGQTPLADFYTREQMSEIKDRTAFEQEAPYRWEACMTIGESWGYKKNDGELMSSEALIRALVDIASRGGNLLLNVGPTPEGEIPAPLAARLRAIGAWMSLYGDAIYGTSASPFPSLPHAYCTTKENTLFLHVDSDAPETISLPGLDNSIKAAACMATGAALPFDNARKTLTLPDTRPHPVIAVYRITLDGPPRITQ